MKCTVVLCTYYTKLIIIFCASMYLLYYYFQVLYVEHVHLSEAK